ncbi:hypothetical protein P5673_027569 [Acropora cervicornis]|uniref:Uncharacterized protein n=1 Tax=Acropora cervicornis TaxID=6130 RepID=A0AAD9PZ69_ACRCE|nr:hypothetical protein P5673_027569 [Acropora cervicornis]
MKATINRSVNEELEVMLSNTLLKEQVSDQLKEEDLKMREEHQILERENGGLEETANANATATSRRAESHTAATATKPTAITQLSDDDDGAATAAVKGFDVVIGKNNTYNR